MSLSPERTPGLVIAFAVLACVLLIGSEVWREWNAREAALLSAGRTTTNLARSLAQHATETFEAMDTALVGLVDQLERDGMSDERLGALTVALQTWSAQLPRLRGLAVLDQHGRVVASSKPASLGDNRSDRGYFRHHVENPGRAPHLGAPVQARTDQRWVVTLSRRIAGPDGRFLGVANLAIDAVVFASFYRDVSVGERGAMGLIRTDGTVLARFPDQDAQPGGAIVPDLLRRMRDAPDGTAATAISPDGDARIVAFRAADKFPFVAVASLSRDEALSEWLRQATLRVAGAGPVILLILAAGILLSSQIRRRQRADMALREAEGRFRLMAENSSDMLCRLDRTGIRTYVSPASERLLGLRPDELVGHSALDRIHPEDRERARQEVARLREGLSETKLTYRTRHRDGTEIWLETTVRVLHDPATGARDGVVTSSRDVTDHKRLEYQLLALARTDSLTGLANRRSFDEALAAEWHRALRTGTPLSLALLDVDRYKLFNDSYGHQAGDECLKLIAGVVGLVARRPGDLVARYGGEEIAILLPGTDAAAAYQTGERARRGVQNLARAHAPHLPFGVVTASVGVVTFRGRAGQGSDLRPAELVEAADRALYEAKRSGRNCVVAAAALGVQDAPVRRVA
jgi:diguanylate cyclase (GGDEF)-like protein/PAS domain S-box-containing protein